MHQNLFVRILAGIAAVLLTALAVFIGALAFLGFLGLAIIAFVVFQLRLWWIRRRLARRRRGSHQSGAASGRPGAKKGRMIEGEFRRDSDDKTD
jgi:membrane protein implicated in regulation of membrane protease activity